MKLFTTLADKELLANCDISIKLSFSKDVFTAYVVFKKKDNEKAEKVKTKLANMKPLVISGASPEELDQEFEKVLGQSVEVTKGVLSNIDEFVEASNKTEKTYVPGGKKKEEPKEKLNKKAQDAINAGDKFFDKKEYTNAKLYYRTANDAQPGSSTIAAKIKKVEDAIAKAGGSQGDMFNQPPAEEKKEEVAQEPEEPTVEEPPAEEKTSEFGGRYIFNKDQDGNIIPKWERTVLEGQFRTLVEITRQVTAGISVKEVFENLNTTQKNNLAKLGIEAVLIALTYTLLRGIFDDDEEMKDRKRFVDLIWKKNAEREVAELFMVGPQITQWMDRPYAITNILKRFMENTFGGNFDSLKGVAERTSIGRSMTLVSEAAELATN